MSWPREEGSRECLSKGEAQCYLVSLVNLRSYLEDHLHAPINFFKVVTMNLTSRSTFPVSIDGAPSECVFYYQFYLRITHWFFLFFFTFKILRVLYANI